MEFPIHFLNIFFSLPICFHSIGWFMYRTFTLFLFSFNFWWMGGVFGLPRTNKRRISNFSSFTILLENKSSKQMDEFIEQAPFFSFKLRNYLEVKSVLRICQVEFFNLKIKRIWKSFSWREICAVQMEFFFVKKFKNFVPRYQFIKLMSLSSHLLSCAIWGKKQKFSKNQLKYDSFF